MVMAKRINVNSHRRDRVSNRSFALEMPGGKMRVVSTLGERARRARLVRGLGVNAVDRALGKGPNSGFTSRLEADDRAPSWQNVRDLAICLNVPIGWLVGERVDDGNVPKLVDIECQLEPWLVAVAVLRVLDVEPSIIDWVRGDAANWKTRSARDWVSRALQRQIELERDRIGAPVNVPVETELEIVENKAPKTTLKKTKKRPSDAESG